MLFRKADNPTCPGRDAQGTMPQTEWNPRAQAGFWGESMRRRTNSNGLGATMRAASGDNQIRQGDRARRRVLLASRSPRRSQLLLDAGVAHEARHPGIDDAVLAPGIVTPAQWVTSLAYLKASTALRSGVFTPSDYAGGEIVLGADTLVVKDGALIGTPEDVADARRILNLLFGADGAAAQPRSRGHEVITGVAIIEPRTRERTLLVDRARVYPGPLEPSAIDEYIATGLWKGKAGGYNLAERLSAGWPIEFDGDPTTIMGLPMRKLTPLLACGN